MFENAREWTTMSSAHCPRTTAGSGIGAYCPCVEPQCNGLALARAVGKIHFRRCQYLCRQTCALWQDFPLWSRSCVSALLPEGLTPEKWHIELPLRHSEGP